MGEKEIFLTEAYTEFKVWYTPKLTIVFEVLREEKD